MKIISRADLGFRLTQSFSRNESKHYKPDVIWTADKNSWPGDWEGRTILALVSLARATGKEPAYLERILDLLPSHLNQLGYLGPIYPDGQISEQQLAGNSWLLRGLIEYTTWKKTNKLLPIIEGILKGLYLPVVDQLDDYFINQYDREGSYSGTIIASRGKWLLSTDTGCAFISADGISQAYELLGWDWLRQYVIKLHDKFITARLVEGKFQTHATLSCTRGIIRLYTLTGEQALLDTAKRIFKLYVECGMTDNFSNCNRFDVALWTEPCCMVDSYMCCVELFKITDNPEYLDLAQKIYFNSLSHSQLPNGGMGLESCLGYHENTALGYNRHKDKGYIYEAYWCCTMRGGDGFSYVSLNQCLKKQSTYTFLNFFDSTVIDDGIEITQKTQYPCYGRVELDVKNALGKSISLKFFIPAFAKTVSVNGNKTQVVGSFITLDNVNCSQIITLEFDVPLQRQPSLKMKGYYKLMLGNVLLGTPDDTLSVGELVRTASFTFKSDNGATFDRIGNTIYKEMQEIDGGDLNVLFKE